MQLFLASLDFGNYIQEFKKFSGTTKNVAIILSAIDFYEDFGRAAYLNRLKEDFTHLGMNASELDLRDYFGKKEALENEIKKFEMVWVVGGNTFVLRKAMHYSGLDEILPLLLKKDTLLYGGFSAGACVVCPTLKGIEFADDPREIPPGYKSETIWDGLNLIEFCLVPHYNSNFAEMDEVKAFYDQNQMNYHTLRDSDVIIVKNGEVKFFKA